MAGGSDGARMASPLKPPPLLSPLPSPPLPPPGAIRTVSAHTGRTLPQGVGGRATTSALTLRVLLASADEGTAGRRAIVGATRRALRTDAHSLGESAFQLGTDARALGMACPPAMVAQLGRAAGTVYCARPDTRPDSERLATLCTAIGDTSALVHAIHLQRCPGQLNKLIIEQAPWLPRMRNDNMFKRLQVLAPSGRCDPSQSTCSRARRARLPEPVCPPQPRRRPRRRSRAARAGSRSLARTPSRHRRVRTPGRPCRRITGHVHAQCAKSSLIRKYLLV
jgi:hypothetical protein